MTKKIDAGRLCIHCRYAYYTHLGTNLICRNGTTTFEAKPIRKAKKINVMKWAAARYPAEDIIAESEDLSAVCVSCKAALGHHKIVGRNCPSKLYYQGKRQKRWLKSRFKESKMPTGEYVRNKKVKDTKKTGKLKLVSQRDLNDISKGMEKEKHKVLGGRKLEQLPIFTDAIDNFDVEDNSVDNETANENVNHPNHYGGDTQYEVIKVLEAWLTKEEFIGFLKGNIIKYTARAGKKDSSTLMQDHAKGSWYDNYLKEFLARS